MAKRTTITIELQDNSLEVDIEGEVMGKELFIGVIEALRTVSRNVIEGESDAERLARGKEVFEAIWEALNEREKTPSTES